MIWLSPQQRSKAMIELNPIELIIFGVGCWVVINIALLAIVWTWNRMIDWGDGSTTLVQRNIKSKLQSALGKKDGA